MMPEEALDTSEAAPLASAATDAQLDPTLLAEGSRPNTAIADETPPTTPPVVAAETTASKTGLDHVAPAAPTDWDRRLTEAEIRERLRISAPGLVEEIHAFVLRQNQAEEQRETRLDSKATMLATGAGVSVTIVFSAGFFLLEKIAVVRLVGPLLGRCLLGLYALGLLFILLAGERAIRALRVRNTYRCATDNDAFNAAEFSRIEGLALQGTGANKTFDNEKARAEFRRYLLPQQWMFFRTHQQIHTEKADLIEEGQTYFARFIMTLLAAGAVIVVWAFLQF